MFLKGNTIDGAHRYVILVLLIYHPYSRDAQKKKKEIAETDESYMKRRGKF